MGRILDINCDCGESFGNWAMGMDEAVMPRITTANVAAGFHGGDPRTLLRTVALAQTHGVNVGCHPGLPDLLGFGRRRMAIDAEDAYAYIVYQVGAVQAALRTVGGTLSHVKPHGALMSMLCTDFELAKAVCRAVRDCADSRVIYFLAPAEQWALPQVAADFGIEIVAEVYPDLSYDAEANVIVQRQKAHTPVAQAVEQLRLFLDEGQVRTVEGGLLRLSAGSVCVHGDGPNAVAVIDALRDLIASRDIAIGRQAA